MERCWRPSRRARIRSAGACVCALPARGSSGTGPGVGLGIGSAAALSAVSAVAGSAAAMSPASISCCRRRSPASSSARSHGTPMRASARSASARADAASWLSSSMVSGSRWRWRSRRVMRVEGSPRLRSPSRKLISTWASGMATRASSSIVVMAWAVRASPPRQPISMVGPLVSGAVWSRRCRSRRWRSSPASTRFVWVRPSMVIVNRSPRVSVTRPTRTWRSDAWRSAFSARQVADS